MQHTSIKRLMIMALLGLFLFPQWLFLHVHFGQPGHDHIQEDHSHIVVAHAHGHGSHYDLLETSHEDVSHQIVSLDHECRGNPFFKLLDLNKVLPASASCISSAFAGMSVLPVALVQFVVRRLYYSSGWQRAPPISQ